MLAHDRKGTGPTAFVLLHSLALDRSVWDAFADELSRDHTVILPDLPGHGASPAGDVTSIEDMADAVGELIREAVGSRAIVMGLSLGGCVAQAVAIRHPELVAGLGLIDTTAWYGETAVADWEGRAQKAASEGFESLAEFQLARWFSPGFRDENVATGDRLLDVFRANRVEDYVMTCRAMGAMDLREDLGSIQAPTMIFVGADDPATPPPHAEAMRRLIPDASMHVQPGCSHLSAVEQPQAIARLVEADLLRRV
jgi:3-oxoadipate enol-lactonase